MSIPTIIFTKKHPDVPALCSPPVLYCTDDALSSNATPVLYYNFKLRRQNFIFSLHVSKIGKQY